MKFLFVNEGKYHNYFLHSLLNIDKNVLNISRMNKSMLFNQNNLGILTQHLKLDSFS